MNNRQIGGHEYMIGQLNAMDQFHVSRRLAPVLPTIMPILTTVHKSGLAEKLDVGGVAALLDEDLTRLTNDLMPLADALATMSDENAEYIIVKCLSVVRRKTEAGAAVMARGGSLVFDDMTMGDMLPLVVAVIQGSLGGFISGLVISQKSATTQPE